MSESEATKIVLLGDSGVGKTSIINRFVTGKILDNISPTVGAAFVTKQVIVEGQTVELRIWDTAGQEVYRGLAPMYYRSSNIAIIVFDVTSNSSFESVDYWIKELKKNLKTNIIITICANKIDNEEERVISQRTAKGLADSNGAIYFEVSAQRGIGINGLFETSVSKMLSEMNGTVIQNQKTLNLNENNNENSNSCC